MKIASYNPANKQQGIVAIEFAFIVTALLIIFSFSWQIGRYLYWQQHFDFVSHRYAKLFVLEITASQAINLTSLEDGLDIIQSQPQHDDFDIGLRIDILSDNTNAEESFQIGPGCTIKKNYAANIKELSDVAAATAKIMPEAYLLGISLCAQPKNWLVLMPEFVFSASPLSSHSYYPISHTVFN